MRSRLPKVAEDMTTALGRHRTDEDGTRAPDDFYRTSTHGRFLARGCEGSRIGTSRRHRTGVCMDRSGHTGERDPGPAASLSCACAQADRATGLRTGGRFEHTAIERVSLAGCAAVSDSPAETVHARRALSLTSGPARRRILRAGWPALTLRSRGDQLDVMPSSFRISVALSFAACPLATPPA
jgi:hypothetical protein